MLPQFGFIVAQAGADSHPPTLNKNPNPTLNNASQLTKPYLPPQQQNDNYYYTRHSSPSNTPILPPPPPLPYMYSSNPSANTASTSNTPTTTNTTATTTTTHDYYHNRYYPIDPPSSYRPLQPLPPPTHLNKNWSNESNYPMIEPYHPTPTPSIWNTTIQPPQPQVPVVEKEIIKKRDEVVFEDPSIHSRWQQEPTEINENKLLNRIRDSNELVTRMDTEFWEQCDEIYREKLQSLQEEIRMIQSGTHSAFKQTLSDIELKREQTIQYADDFKNYELSLSKKQFEHEISLVQDEYENEKHNLHDIILQAIEEKKKLVREDKEEKFDVKDLFKDAYAKIHSKRNLRKRTPFDRHNSSSPSRLERRRRERQATPHNIHATPTSMEEDELESEFITMKGGNSSRRQTSQLKR